VDIVDDVIELESSHTTVRWGVLLAVVLAAVLLAGILGLTWMVVGRLHTHVDRLSMHVDSLSVRWAKVCEDSLHDSADMCRCSAARAFRKLSKLASRLLKALS
jgi:outer membrane murein-binding lipoprotein Lpp